MIGRALVALTAFAVVVQAHFQINYPVPRDPFDEDLMTEFCDSATSGARTEFGLGPTVIKLTSSHDTANITAMLTLKRHPTEVADFNHIIRPSYTHTGAGELCFGVNIGALHIPGAHHDAKATIQISNTMNGMIMYQCADVILKRHANTVAPVCATVD